MRKKEASMAIVAGMILCWVLSLYYPTAGIVGTAFGVGVAVRWMQKQMTARDATAKA